MAKFYQNSNFTKNEHGSTLLVVLFTLVLISVLGMSLLVISSNTLKTSTNERTDQAVFYIAEAALVERKAKLESEIDTAYTEAVTEYKEKLIENSKKKPPLPASSITFSKIFKIFLDTHVSLYSNQDSGIAFEEQFSKTPSAKVTILTKPQPTKIIYTIESEGFIGDPTTSSRTVSQEITVNLNSASFDGGSPDGNYAIYARKEVKYAYYDMKNKVTGDIASATYNHVVSPGSPIPLIHDPDNFDKLLSAKYKDYLAFPSERFKDATYYPNDSNFIVNNSLIANNWNVFQNKTLVLSNNLKLSTFSLRDNLTFTIDVGDSDKILYVDKFEIPNGTLNITGSGKLTIFVEDEIAFGNTYLNLKASPDKLDIYYAGNKGLNFANNVFLKANLYIKQANINYQNGGGFNGTLYSNGYGNIRLAGGVYNESIKFVVPNYDFTVTEGATVKGSIICNNVLLSGGASIIGSSSNSLDDSISIEQSVPKKIEPLVEQ